MHEWTRKSVTASMAVVMAFGLTPALPMTALADESPSVASASQEALAIGVSSEENLIAAVDSAASGTLISLEGDIELSKVLTIPEGKNIILDLAGHTLSVPKAPAGSSLYAIHNYGTLLIKDSSEGSGAIESRGVQNNGNLTLESGSIVSFDSNGGGAAVWNKGDFLMTGGSLSFVGEKSGNGAGAPLNNQAGAFAEISGGELLSPYTCIFSSGDLKVSDIQLQSSTDFWMTVKLYADGLAEFNNVTIKTTNGGCVENAGGNAVLKTVVSSRL